MVVETMPTIPLKKKKENEQDKQKTHEANLQIFRLLTALLGALPDKPEDVEQDRIGQAYRDGLAAEDKQKLELSRALANIAIQACPGVIAITVRPCDVGLSIIAVEQRCPPSSDVDRPIHKSLFARVINVLSIQNPLRDHETSFNDELDIKCIEPPPGLEEAATDEQTLAYLASRRYRLPGKKRNIRQHLWIIRRLLVSKSQSGALKSTLLKIYVIASCFLRMKTRYNHMMSVPFMESLLHIDKFTYDPSVLEEESQADRDFLNFLKDLKAKTNIVTVLDHTHTHLYTGATSMAFHKLLCDLLKEFNRAVHDLSAADADLRKEPCTTFAESSEKFSDALSRALHIGHGLHLLSKSTGLERHLKAIEEHLLNYLAQPVHLASIYMIGDPSQNGGDQNGGDQNGGDQNGGDQNGGDQNGDHQDGDHQDGGNQSGGNQKGGKENDDMELKSLRLPLLEAARAAAEHQGKAAGPGGVAMPQNIRLSRTTPVSKTYMNWIGLLTNHFESVDLLVDFIERHRTPDITIDFLVAPLADQTLPPLNIFFNKILPVDNQGPVSKVINDQHKKTRAHLASAIMADVEAVKKARRFLKRATMSYSSGKVVEATEHLIKAKNALEKPRQVDSGAAKSHGANKDKRVVNKWFANDDKKQKEKEKARKAFQKRFSEEVAEDGIKVPQDVVVYWTLPFVPAQIDRVHALLQKELGSPTNLAMLDELVCLYETISFYSDLIDYCTGSKPFGGTLHCEAVLCSLLPNTIAAQLGPLSPKLKEIQKKIAGFSRIIGISKRCCPVCWKLLEVLTYDNAQVRYVVAGFHSEFSACSLPPWLAKLAVEHLVDFFGNSLRPLLIKLAINEPVRGRKESSGSQISTTHKRSLFTLDLGSLLAWTTSRFSQSDKGSMSGGSK
ncbi:hypothetical protein CVT26_010633 [Gymnopilus dilepis]|uniref:Uncharacterized protein n=1 Tax=Gymnopilus dilepis TaxID=231916 RepID=A0A409Y0Z1_9AGAR|nr:hypothetical protein CVT26_010633 [Gymnopilus dilepis]